MKPHFHARRAYSNVTIAMGSPGIPIEDLFEAAPLSKIDPRIASPGTPALPAGQIQPQIGLQYVSTTSDAEEFNVALALSEHNSVPLKIVEAMDKYAFSCRLGCYVLLTLSSFPYLHDNLEEYKEFMYHFYRLHVKDITEPLGFVHSSVIVGLPWPDYWMYSPNDKSLMFSGGNDVDERNKLLTKTLLDAKDKAKKSWPLVPLLHLWGQRMPVYSYDGLHVMDVDVAATEMFGVPNYSVSLIAWTTVDSHRRYWIPQLGSDHQTRPGKYDNFVCGLLEAGDTHFERIEQLAESQAWLSTDFTNLNLKFCGTISYIAHNHKGSSRHTIQPHVQYVYEIELEPEYRPRDTGDCQSIKKYSPFQAYSLLAAGEFEPHSQMTLLDHFVRHWYINAGNEPRLQEIQTRLHRRVEFLEV